MSDLYADLGVPRDADPDTIKRAHRALVRRHHPDLGGTAEDFHRVQHAFDVLSDARRRDRYDQTGSDEDVSAAVLEAQVRQGVTEALSNAIRQSLNPDTQDLGQAIRAGLAQRGAEIRNKQDQLAGVKRKVESALKRFRPRAPGKGRKKAKPPPVGMVAESLGQMLAEVNKQIAGVNDFAEIHGRVVAVFEAMDYDFDKVSEGQTHRTSTWTNLFVDFGQP